MPTKSKSKKIIIGFVGKICSGKGVAVKYIKKKHNTDSDMFSRSMRDILDRLYLPQSRENMQKISLLLRQNYGGDIFSKTMVSDILRNKAKYVVIDGFRRVEDVQAFRKLPSFTLIHIEAPEELRFKRLKERNQNHGDSKKSWKKFLTEDNAETEETIAKTAKLADVHIENIGTLKDFHKKLDEIIKEIK